jgi:vitamin B12 transporter
MSFVVGGAAERQSVHSRGRDSFTPAPYTFDETRSNQAAFAQMAGGGRLLSFDVSGRRESYRGATAVSTGRAAVASKVAPGTLLRASIGRGFKEPALDQLYNTSFAVGNADLLPERSRVVDVGGETRIGRLMFGATYFTQRFTDLIQYRFDVANPAGPNYYNVAAARADGVEFEGRLDPWHSIGLRGSYTLLETEVTRPGTSMALETGKPLFRRPRRQGVLSMDGVVRGAPVHAMVERTGARDDLAFVGFTASRVRLEPYTLLTAAVEVPLTRTEAPIHPALVVRGENLGGARYQNAAGFDMPGRTVYLGLRARW